MKSFKEILESSELGNPKNFIKLCKSNSDLTSELKSEIIELNKKLKYEEHEFPIIFIGMGTCGLASGALKVKEAIEKELEKFNLRAEIVPTGCIGYCAKEVIVDIKLPDESRISYCEVTVKDVPMLIRKTIVEQDIYEEKLLG
ncbi:MAG: (2Fe-2S) ferredoxin domain-containing protein, partial [Ignavibacteriae bacterium]|nr:(2Fe-2S) ferredoxin domain-containing protein [Ignavibacteriota bacterium]